MSFVTDDFISYNEELLIKQEKLSIDDDSLIGSSTSESTPPYPSSMNQALQNLLNTNDQSLTLEPFTYASLFSAPPKKQPFKIIRTHKPEIQKTSTETFEVKIESEDKLVSRTKRIMKREKAKQRLRIKQEASPALSSVNSKYIPDGFDNPDLDDKSKRKMVQMIRNRISAQNSRDRKKAYMMQLEEAKSILAVENNKLSSEKGLLLKQLKKLEKTQRKLQHENADLKKCWEENCQQCGQNKGFHSMEEEPQEPKTTLSKIINKFTEPIMNKLPEGQKPYNKKTMTLATIISIVMVMNLVQQGTTLLQGGAGKTKSAPSSIGQVEKKILQQAIAANLSGDKTAQSLEIVERIMPLMQKFGENQYNNFQKEATTANENENEMEAATAPVADLSSFIKLEEFGEVNEMKPMDFLAAFKERQTGFSLDDDDMLLNEENADKKSQTSTYFSAHPFDYCNNDGKINLEDEQETEINIKNFGLGKLQFTQSGIKRQFGGGDEPNKKIENNLLTSWSGVFGNSGFEYN